MTDEARKKLIDLGRQDLIDIYELNKSGYAGIDPKSGIVDRRLFPKATAIQKNTFLNIPTPKKLK